MPANDSTFGGGEMRPEQDDLAAAAEYICVHLHPPAFRIHYVNDVRGPRLWGDAVYWERLIWLALQALSTGMTDLFIALLASWLYDKFRKPDANVEQLLEKQRTALARLDALIAEGEQQAERARVTQERPERKFAAVVHDDLWQHIHAVRQFHESMLIKIRDADPAIASMVEDALRQLEARGAKALVDDTNVAANLPASAFPTDERGRWWWRPEWRR